MGDHRLRRLRGRHGRRGQCVAYRHHGLLCHPCGNHHLLVFSEVTSNLIFDRGLVSYSTFSRIKDQVTGYFTKNKQMVTATLWFAGGIVALRGTKMALEYRSLVMRSKMSACYLIRLDLVNK